MKFKIEIECDNAAFDDDPTGEIRWILQQRVIEELSRYGRDAFPIPLSDSNGNRVGMATLSKEN